MMPRCFLPLASIALLACGGSSSGEAKDPPPPLFADVVVPPAPRPPPPSSSSDAGDGSPLFAPSPDASVTIAGGPAASASAGAGRFFDVTPSPTATAAPQAGGNSVTAAITALRPSFRRCYREALDSDPSVKGDMTVEIVVKTDGTTGAMHSDARGLPAQLVSCIQAAIRAGRFDGVATNGDAHVVIPLHLAKP